MNIERYATFLLLLTKHYNFAHAEKKRKGSGLLFDVDMEYGYPFCVDCGIVVSPQRVWGKMIRSEKKLLKSFSRYSRDCDEELSKALSIFGNKKGEVTEEYIAEQMEKWEFFFKKYSSRNLMLYARSMPWFMWFDMKAGSEKRRKVYWNTREENDYWEWLNKVTPSLEDLSLE